MNASSLDAGDSRAGAGLRHGPAIPGHPAAAAWTLHRCGPVPLPVLIAVPHAGRAYGEPLLRALREPAQAALRLEDRLVDLIGHAVARNTGASLLVAHAPRALIDLNRATDDVDWSMIRAAAGTGEHPDGAPMPRPSASRPGGGRAASGLGLIPRRLPGMGELWRHPVDAADLARRIAHVHEPYHAALAEALAVICACWGAALLVDLHSMPPLPARGGPPPAQFVVGDRFGVACDGALVASAFAELARAGVRTAHNRPYAGGYVLERHTRRAAGIHGLQLEICRAAYLDSQLTGPGEGLAATVATVTALVQRLAADVAELGRASAWRAAAE